MRLIGYCRVSSEEQCREGISLVMQESRIRSYCQANNVELLTVIADEGVSAKDVFHRRGFQEALALLDTGKADGIVSWRQDRLFRNVVDSISIKALLERRGQKIITIADPINGAGATAKFHYGLQSLLGEFERHLVSERTVATVAQKRSRLEKTGGAQCPYGFRLSVDGLHLEIDPEEAEVVALVLDLHEQGVSYRGIAKRLNEAGYVSKTGRAWNHRTVGRVLAVQERWAVA